MKKNSIFLFMALWCAIMPGRVWAQLSEGGTPVSFLVPQVSSARVVVPRVEMPLVDVAALKREDMMRDKDLTKPLRFGKRLEVALHPGNSGAWHTLPNGDKLWRLTIVSKGALTLNFIFSRFNLPEGGQLFLYNANHSDVIGAFTAANNQPDQMLGTTLVKGQEVTIEYYQPAHVTSSAQLEVGTVVHGYRSIPSLERENAGGRFGESGACNINVNCPEGASWQNQKRSVARIVVNGGDWCTGALINNTANDGKPYFLTADHCFSNNVSTWVFWFNYEAAGCPNPATEPGHVSISGSSLRARNSTSDFCLLELNSAPPASYSPFYAGWDRSGVVPGAGGASIHHPSGDIKKISLATISSGDANFWKASWTTNSITEPGSSGSPLFDSNKRIVGQLLGGPSFCGVDPSGKYDNYGKVSVSWNTGGTAATRLRDWLDPTGTNATAIDGYDPGGTTIILTVSPGNQNVTAAAGTTSFAITANTSWTASTSASWLTLLPTSGNGNGTLSVSYTANTGTATRTGTITVAGGGLTRSVTVTQLGTGGSTCSNDNEPANNTRANAPAIALNADKQSLIFTNTDRDWWKITLASATTLRITLTTLPGDYDINLYNSGGSVLARSENPDQQDESITYTAAAGTYYVRIIGYNGVFSTTQCYTLRATTGASLTEEVPTVVTSKSAFAKTQTIAISPNPTDGQLHVTLPVLKGETRVHVLDMLGHLVLTHTGQQPDRLINLSHLPKGIYMVTIVNDEEGLKQTQKVVLLKE